MKNETLAEQVQEDLAESSLSLCREFDQIIENTRQFVFRFLLASSRNAELAEELTQECFLKAYRNWSGFRGESSARTWILRIAINLERDHWRNRRLQFWRQIGSNAVDAIEAANCMVSKEPSPEGVLLAREKDGRLWRAVERLPQHQRRVFHLRYVEELEVREIARATGLCTGTVKTHLSRALARVRHAEHLMPTRAGRDLLAAPEAVVETKVPGSSIVCIVGRSGPIMSRKER